MRGRLKKLQAAYPWPLHPPEVEPDLGPMWFVDDDHGHTGALKLVVPRRARVILELGSFVGRSTAAFLRLCPRAHVIAIDTWRGSPEHHDEPALAGLLPRLYETFQVNLWRHRQRVVPIRTDTLTGMRVVHKFGVVPDMVYVDADHATQSVVDDLRCILELFPPAQIVGDDWLWPSVRAAVERVARERDLLISVCGALWWFSPSIQRRGPATFFSFLGTKALWKKSSP